MLLSRKILFFLTFKNFFQLICLVNSYSYLVGGGQLLDQFIIDPVFQCLDAVDWRRAYSLYVQKYLLIRDQPSVQ